MSRKPYREDRLWTKIDKIKTGDIYKRSDIENLLLAAMTKYRNEANTINRDGRAMALQIIRNVFEFHGLTETMKRYQWM